MLRSFEAFELGYTWVYINTTESRIKAVVDEVSVDYDPSVIFQLPSAAKFYDAA